MLGKIENSDKCGIRMKYTVNGYPKREFTLIELIKEYQSKAGTIHTKNKAHAIWKVLFPLIKNYFGDSKISFVHWINVAESHQISEGRGELDYFCNKLIALLKNS